jgi:hypothetical protein
MTLFLGRSIFPILRVDRGCWRWRVTVTQIVLLTCWRPQCVFFYFLSAIKLS